MGKLWESSLNSTPTFTETTDNIYIYIMCSGLSGRNLGNNCDMKIPSTGRVTRAPRFLAQDHACRRFRPSSQWHQGDRSPDSRTKFWCSSTWSLLRGQGALLRCHIKISKSLSFCFLMSFSDLELCQLVLASLTLNMN